MGAGESSQNLSTMSDTVQERTKWIRDREIAKTALRDYLQARDKDIPEDEVNIQEYVAKSLTSDEFSFFKRQFRFGGRQSLNFFVVTGISDEFDNLPSAVISEFHTAKEVQDEKGKPFLTDTREFDDRLYLILGRYVSTKTVDPLTGKPQRRLDPDECVAVVNRDTDLVHVRTAEVPLARRICKKMAASVGIDTDREDIFYKPRFDGAFIDEFSKRIEKYINMNLRIREGSDRKAGSVKFTSKKDERGEYMDLREDKQVQKELKQGDGNISQGYLQLEQGDFALHLNRPQSKIWFKSFEREERLNEIEELIDDVLRQSGGYPQQKLQGFENVPE